MLDIAITRIGGLTTDTAFNGALTPYEDGYLLAYRAMSAQHDQDKSIGFAKLDKDLNVVPGTAWDRGYVRNDDPRIIPGNLVPGLQAQCPFLMATNYWEGHWLNSKMELRQMDVYRTGDIIRPDEVVHLGKFDTIGALAKQHTEKNWTPFITSAGLRMVYSITPHRVLAYDYDSRGVTLAHTVDWTLPDWWRAEWGTDLRGSSPPALVGDAYLSTWHTHTDVGYFSGFYMFAAEAPHAPIAISPPVLLPEHATGTNRVNHGGQNCIFVSGMVVEQDRVLLSGGDNDHSVIVVAMDRPAVIATLRVIGR